MNIIDSFLKFSLLGAEWVMWILIALSLISLTVMIERVVYFFGQRPDISHLREEILKLLRSGDISGARKQVAEMKGVAATVARTALAEADRGPDAVDEAAIGALIQERLRLERNLAFLGTVGNNAPFVGLFGTVIGIILAFSELSLNTQGGASAVMAGISEALVATALGLFVAIPAVAAFNIFQRRIRAITSDADSLVHVILSGLKGRTRG
ncbi:MAG: MotA/TolQ/ExbB proton channel family protein [Proteobacteria bacterium]|nr:MotA/TolQ/ExbB proton channel family protein [Pseudomonadota bacterium]